MKPKRFSALKNFTVPVFITITSLSKISVVNTSILCDQSLSFISLIVSNSPSVHYHKSALLERTEIPDTSQEVYCADYFQSVSSTTPPTIMAALRTILDVTRSTSRKNVAAKINEKNGPVLAIGITTETLPKSNA